MLKLINSLETIFRECLNVISQQEAAQKFYSKTIGGMFTKENAAWARDCLESWGEPSLRTTSFANC